MKLAGDDQAEFFECKRCSLAWSAHPDAAAPPYCPNCCLPWDRAPLFVPAVFPPPIEREA